MRGLISQCRVNGVHDTLPAGELNFTTGVLMDHLRPRVNDLIARVIQNKVQRQPSCGKTLARTR